MCMSFYKGVLVLTAALGFSACSRASQPAGESAAGTAGGADTVQINGMGATFPNPIYSKWFTDYNRLHPNIQINYQSQGSGAGIRGLTSKTVFFGASDMPMNEQQLKDAGSAVLHLPTVLGAVVPVYNLPGVSQELKFSGPVLADVVLGKITKWNDPALVKVNPGVKLPDTPITFVHRSDGSGTTFIFLDFLGKVSPALKEKVGVNTSVSWPVGVGGKGNEGVAGLVSQTPGSLGYVELIYALQNQIAYGSVQNSAGAFVKPSIESVTAAADAAASNMPEDFRVSITNPQGEASYPAASFTWILLYENPDDKQKAKVMVDFMKWALTEGQQSARELGYAPLPKNVVDMEMKALSRIQVQ
jgi:phosphate transport system substrate-binding protein